MKYLMTIITLILLLSISARAQATDTYGNENHFFFGYTTQTGNFGPNGFEVGLDYRLRSFLAIAAEGSFMFSSERINDVETNLTPNRRTDVRLSASNYNIQAGPRFFFPKAFRQPKMVPFGHLLFGVSRESADFELTSQDDQIGSAADTNWSWTLGGGVDYWFNEKWSVRGKVDLLKTHFGGEGQTKARFTASVVYNFDWRK